MPPRGTAVVHVGKEEIKARCPWCSISCWSADLGEHGFAVLGHHAALVTVEGHKVAVECLLGVLKYIIQLCSTPLKNAAEVAWDQGPADGCKTGQVVQDKGISKRTKADLLRLLDSQSTERV